MSLPLDNLPKPENFSLESDFLCAFCVVALSGVKLPESDDDSDNAIFLRSDYAIKEEFTLNYAAKVWEEYILSLIK